MDVYSYLCNWGWNITELTHTGKPGLLYLGACCPASMLTLSVHTFPCLSTFHSKSYWLCNVLDGTNQKRATMKPRNSFQFVAYLKNKMLIIFCLSSILQQWHTVLSVLYKAKWIIFPYLLNMFCVIPWTALAVANRVFFYECSNFTELQFIICLLSIKMLHSANIFSNADNILKACQKKSTEFLT